MDRSRKRWEGGREGAREEGKNVRMDKSVQKLMVHFSATQG